MGMGSRLHKILDAVCKAQFGKSSSKILKEILTEHKLPEEISVEQFEEEFVRETVQDIFGPESLEAETPNGGGDYMDWSREQMNEHILGSGTVKQMRSHASEYAEFFRIKAEEARRKKEQEQLKDEEEGMTVQEAKNILGIKGKMTEKILKKRFRELAVKWHPDSNPGNKKIAEEKFKKIINAYDRLTKDGSPDFLEEY